MQIQLITLKGFNVLSYGDFEVALDSNRVTQLLGKNGSGKSSLATILEEVLYNSNSRGIKKAKLLHRYSGTKGWWAEVTFRIGDVLYAVHKDVKTTTKVTLTGNGEDLSGHTATQTYAAIKEILGGLDFKTFSKLVYQSMKSSLDFLEATDTARKKFLTSFLGLEKYGAVEDKLKEQSKAITSDLEGVTKDLHRVTTWEANASRLEPVSEDITIPEVVNNTPELEEVQSKIAEITGANAVAKAYNLDIKNKQVRFEKYRRAAGELAELKAKMPSKPEYLPTTELMETSSKLNKLDSELSTVRTSYQYHRDSAADAKCSRCGNEVDVHEHIQKREELKGTFMELREQRKAVDAELDKLKAEVSANELYQTAEALIKTKESALEAYGDVETNTNPVLQPIESTDTLDKEFNALLKEEKDSIKAIVDAEHRLAMAIQHNKMYQEQVDHLEEYVQQKKELQKEHDDLSEKKGLMAVLLKAFGPKGLLGYKIESSIKVFEDLINKYLTVFTDGQFALSFQLDGTKLMVVIYDSGVETEMSSVSSGEAAKINISTLLAIRNLMTAVSKVNINVLYLDEVISVLDVEAIDTLINLLLEEHDLNTFIVSHNFEHPLTTSLNVVKKNKVSTIQ